MRRWLGPVLVLLVSAAAAHAATLHFAPGIILGRALTALAARGVALHAFTAPPRVTPQTQSVVRSSPDLYYALCRYDLSQPAHTEHAVPILNVKMAAWDDYQSLSFFDARTNNFATIRGTGKAIEVALMTDPGGSGSVITAAGDKSRQGQSEVTVFSPTATGVILIRRLAQTDMAFAKAAAIGRGDQCFYGMQPTIVL